MKNSGITRRIDELGRIVVPKELRNNLGIRDGEPLEIYTENNAIIIKKYSRMESLKEISDKLTKIVSNICNIGIIITDREKIVANSINEEKITTSLEGNLKYFIDNREAHLSEYEENYLNLSGYFYILPIINSSDSIGLVILHSDKNNIEGFIPVAKIVRELLIA